MWFFLHIVLQNHASTCGDDLKREVFVRIQPRHSSGSLVRLDLGLDFVLVSADVSPGVGEVLGAQRGVCLQELLFRCAQTAGLFEKPDGNPGADEAGIAATDFRAGIDAWQQPCHAPIVAE